MPETGEGIPKTKVAEKANPLPEGGRESSEQSRLNERTGQRRTGASLLRKLLPPPTREDHDLRQSSFKIQEIGAELDGIEAKKTAEVNPAMPAKPLPHEKDNGMNKSIDAKSKEPETEMIVLRDDDGRVVGSFPVRKNATIAELNQAAKASGIDFRVSLVGTALNSPGQAIKDLRNTVKKGKS
jgi:hypothetical protein